MDEILYTHNAEHHWCMDQPKDNSVGFFRCHGMGGNQKWIWDKNAYTIKSHNNLCLTNNDDNTVTVSPCNGSKTQEWRWSDVW